MAYRQNLLVAETHCEGATHRARLLGLKIDPLDLYQVGNYLKLNGIIMTYASNPKCFNQRHSNNLRSAL